jgi:TPR repeat protein
MQAHTQAAPNQDPQVTLVEQQAQQGSAQAQCQLGYWYDYGYPIGDPSRWSVPMNLPQAVVWLTKAAQQGYAPAQEQLATIYYAYWSGQNYTQALYWYQKAVAQGANAMSAGYYASYLAAGRWSVDVEKIAWMYLNGLGVTKNQAEAISWLNKILALNQAAASTPGVMDDLMGRLYINQGLHGTDRFNNMQQARAWLQKAANLGNPDAINALAQLNAQASPAPAATQPAPAPQQAAPQQGQGICAAVYLIAPDDTTYGHHWFYGAAWNWATLDGAESAAQSKLVQTAAGVDPADLPGGQYAPSPAPGSGCTYAHGAVAGKLKIAPSGGSAWNPGGAGGTSPLGPGIYDAIAANFANSTDAAVSTAMSQCQTTPGSGNNDAETCAVLEQW